MTVVEWIEMWRDMLRADIKTSNCNYWNILWRWQHYYIYYWGYCQWCKESIYIKYILTLFEKINALRRPERLENFLKSNKNDFKRCRLTYTWYINRYYISSWQWSRGRLSIWYKHYLNSLVGSITRPYPFGKTKI